MEFHSLMRKELQSLCKKNRIPANMTNVAMADALKSLENVEGIEELFQPNESESLHSSVESPARSEITSPYVPPTGERTTRGRTKAREAPQTLRTISRTRATTRKPQTKNEEEPKTGATKSPTLATQARRRVPAASACRKMESQLKECAEEEEKKGVPVTPVALADTSLRRGLKKESEIRRVYSTRRSARLAGKNMEMPNEVKNETSEILRGDLFMKEDGDKVEMNVKEVSDGVHEVSETTEVDVETSLEEKLEKKDSLEVSSGKRQYITNDDDESKLESKAEEKLRQNSEADGPNPEMAGCIVDAGDERFSSYYETGSQLYGANKTEYPSRLNFGTTLNMAFQDGEGSIGICLFESKCDKDKAFEDTIDHGVDNISLEGNVNVVKQDEVGEEIQISQAERVDNGAKEASEEEPLEKTSCSDIENLQIEGSRIASEKVPENVLVSIDMKISGSENAVVDSPLHLDADSLESKVKVMKQDEVGEENVTSQTKDVDDIAKEASKEEPRGEALCRDIEVPQIEAIEIAAEEVPDNVLSSVKWQLINGSEGAVVDSLPRPNADFLETNVEKRQDEVGEDEESNPIRDAESVPKTCSSGNQWLGKTSCQEVEILPNEESEQTADVPSVDAVKNALTSIKHSPTKHLGDVAAHSPMNQSASFLKEIQTSGTEGIPILPGFAELASSFTTQLKSVTPTKKSASKTSVTAKRIADVWDNKENISSSCDRKLVITKERGKILKDIAEDANQNTDFNNLSVRKLTKMLKEKLQITNKSSHNDNNGTKAMARPALQTLPENRLRNETKN